MSTPASHPVGDDQDQHLARRRLLQAAAGVAVAASLTACQESPLRSAGGSPDQGTAQADPDEALLAAAARDEAQMVAVLEPLLGTAPVAVRRTLQVHRDHLALLDRAEQDDEGSAAGPRLRLEAIATAEERLARRHARAARRASSGQFARVLAAMAASAAQQAEVWRRGGADG